MEFPQSHICCGAAGSYAITQSESSEAILKMKMNDIERTGAETVVTSNPGCQIQIQKGIDKYLPNLEVKHICEILDILYRQDSDYVKTFKL
jgi:glycolate oxidase iron-sulfur subunit